MKILAFVQALLPRVEKDRLLEDIRITLSELDAIVEPSYSVASDFFRGSKMKSTDNKDLADMFYRGFDLQGGPKQGNFISDINRRLPFIKANLTYIQGLIEELMERDVINEGLTAKKAILIRAVEHISFVSRFATDLLNLTYVNEAGEVDADVEEAMRLSPGAIKHVQRNLLTFASLVSNYGIPSKDFEKLVLNIPEIVISSKNSSAIAGMYKEQEIDPFASSYMTGFSGNPIYHLRLLVAEWQANRYKANKDKKKVLELRLLHLKLLQEKKNDPKIENEITYIQNRVDKIEHYLREVEASVEVGV